MLIFTIERFRMKYLIEEGVLGPPLAGTARQGVGSVFPIISHFQCRISCVQSVSVLFLDRRYQETTGFSFLI